MKDIWMGAYKLYTAFSGIGAPELAARRVYKKVKVVGSCEINKFARESYGAIHGEPVKYDDIHTLHYDSKKKVDLYCFGFPCQDYSLAGKRAGLEGQRGTLFYEGARLLKEMQPKVFIAENVKGLLSSNKGEDFKTIMDILENEIGYHCTYKVLNSKDFNVPQNRERVFIVGFKKKKHLKRFKFPESVPLTKTLNDVLEDEVDDKFYLSDEQVAGFKSSTGALEGRLSIKGNDQIKRVYRKDGVSPTLTTSQGGNRQPKVIAASRGRNPSNPSSRVAGEPTVQRLEVNKQGTSNCLTTVLKDNYVLDGRIRKLTPREYWRLQDFPDWAFDKAQEVCSNSQLYRQAGNSITVKVMEELIRCVSKKNG